MEETIYLDVYISRVQLIMSWTWIIDENINQTKVETVDTDILEHLLEQVNELQMDLEVIIGDLIPIRHEGKQLGGAISLDKVFRKIKFTLTRMTSVRTLNAQIK